MTQRVYVDRSRYETAQACARRRWLEYHEGGGGIVSARKPLPLAVGGAVHEGLAVLLRTGQHLMDELSAERLTTSTTWALNEEMAVAAALRDFAQFDGGRIALEPTEAPAADAPMVTDYDRYLYAEQSALVEALVRAYARRRLRPLLEQFTVLEVEREGEWVLAHGYADVRTGADSVTLPFEYDLVFMSRPDALLLERSSGQLYLQSFKTTSGWDVRRARDAEHDMQGLSEGVEVERRLADWWTQLQDGFARKVANDERLCNHATLAFLKSCAAPPRILGIRYEYLLKGSRDGRSRISKDLAARFNFTPYAQGSNLCYGYLNAGMASGDEQWNCSWDFLKPDGTGESSKLNYRAWRSVPVWEHMTTAAWVTMLDESAMAVSGDTGGELGYKSAAQATGYLAQHPLDEVFLAPIVIYRNDDDLRDMVEQMEAAERRTAEGVAVVTAASDEGERRSLLNRHFPQTRRACSWPTECPYVKICYGGEDIRRAPMASGLYRIRTFNHPQERGDA